MPGTPSGQRRRFQYAARAEVRSPARAEIAGADDAELARRWVAAMAAKLPGHGIDDPTFLQPSRPMSAIGG